VTRRRPASTVDRSDGGARQAPGFARSAT
jgi:hypothetical protein